MSYLIALTFLAALVLVSLPFVLTHNTPSIQHDPLDPETEARWLREHGMSEAEIDEIVNRKSPK